MNINPNYPDKIEAWQMVRLRAALRLEIKGMRHSSGRSVSKHIRETYGLQCGWKKTDVLAAYEAYLVKKGVMQ